MTMPRARVSVALTLSVFALLAGCAACGDDTGDADGGVPFDAAANWLEIGTGFDRFIPYAEPATAELIAGPQGGFHIWTSLRARNPATTMSPLVEIEYERVRDGMIVSYPFRVRVSFDRVPGAELQEIYGLRCEALSSMDLLDEDVIIRARVETRDGTFVVVEQRAHVVRGTGPMPRGDGGLEDGGGPDGMGDGGAASDAGASDGGASDGGASDAGASDGGADGGAADAG